jgi:hypothetical protein
MRNPGKKISNFSELSKCSIQNRQRMHEGFCIKHSWTNPPACYGSLILTVELHAASERKTFLADSHENVYRIVIIMLTGNHQGTIFPAARCRGKNQTQLFQISKNLQKHLFNQTRQCRIPLVALPSSLFCTRGKQKSLFP